MAFRNASLLTAGMQTDPILAPMSIRSILGRLSPRMRNTDSILSKSYGSLYTYTCLPIILSDEEITNVSAGPALKSKVFGLARSKIILLRSFKSKKGRWLAEPEPRNYSLLSANIHINGLSDKIVAYNFALGRKDDEQLLLELSKGSPCPHPQQLGLKKRCSS